VFPVRYEMDFYIPEDGILHSHCGGNFKSYILASVAISAKNWNMFSINFLNDIGKFCLETSVPN
jgi:hypothetical protein